ncbi:zinc ABC transporter substrate-binding protein [Lachnospiraceae bacterium 54-53]
MNQKIKVLLGIVTGLSLLAAGCSAPAANADTANADSDSQEGALNVVATTTMLADLSEAVGGERVIVNGLMGPGIDPHLYQASAGDVSLMQKADVVVYNGLHLEGKMGEIFENLSGQGQTVICIEDGLDESSLLAWEDDSSVHDPHIWFDVSLWKAAARTVAAGLSKADPDGKADYEANLGDYLKELDETDQYIRDRAAELSEAQRVLVTAHDAFQYFGKAYGFEVRGLQGISTDAEAGTADVSDLADFIVERQIKAIFVESSVPPKTIEALQAAVKAKGFEVAIGGELYSDSLGDAESGAGTYILTVKANIDTIVDALK